MIYLVHHAEAAAPGLDPQRPLTPAGRAHADRLAADARERGVKPDVIWHSGKLRARQTAEAFWRTCNPFAGLTAIRGLQPSDPPGWIRDTLVDELRSVMLVGHMPHLPRALALLVTGRDDNSIAFPLHGLVALEPTGRTWTERWRIVV
jgi:phosphohistidine phosphatase